MIAILVIIIFGLVGVVWGLKSKLGRCKKEILVVERERDEFAEIGRGLEEYNKKILERKDLAKGKIWELVGKKGKICSSDVVDGLGISHSSAMRYLDEFEKEGKIKQVGKTGKSVFYTK